ncbi:MAG: class I SAM-dependent methyltransferase [Methylocella sp.]
MFIVAMLRKAGSEVNFRTRQIVGILRLREVVPKIAREGPINAARAALRFVFTPRRPIGEEFDARYRTDTAGNDPLWRYRIASKNAVFGTNYGPSDEGDFLRALKMVEEDFSTMTFIDVGCGKGKPLLLASDLGFKQLVGVEFVLELVEVARKNLMNKNISNGTILYADAAEYEFPDSDCVVYLGNPFERPVMTKVIANLAKIKHRKIYVVYWKAALAADFDQCGFLAPIASMPVTSARSEPRQRVTRVWRSVA